MTNPQPWRPVNETQQGMLAALQGGDRPGYFRILATAKLYLPVVSREPGAQEFVTAELFGVRFLLVFTSVEEMAQYVAGAAGSYTMTSYPELRDKWPVPTWRLAVDPGSPLEAYLPIDLVEAAADGSVTIPTAAEALGDAARVEPSTMDTELGLNEPLGAAVARADPAGVLDALLPSAVVVPTAVPVADPERLLEPGFPWLPGGPPDDPLIEVFTSVELWQSAGRTGPSLEVPFVALLTVWPAGYRLAVNPGTAVELELGADQVELLLLWPREVG
jgi:hypothetical protein